MNALMKARVYLCGFSLGAALLLAPAAFAQADSSPDHFIETSVELSSGSTAGQVAAHPVAVSHMQKSAKPAKAQAAATASRSAEPVNVAAAVADRKRPATLHSPKR